MKVECFTVCSRDGGSISDLMEDVNEWLEQHPNVEICFIKQCMSGCTAWLTIVYK